MKKNYEKQIKQSLHLKKVIKKADKLETSGKVMITHLISGQMKKQYNNKSKKYKSYIRSI